MSGFTGPSPDSIPSPGEHSYRTQLIAMLNAGYIAGELRKNVLMLIDEVVAVYIDNRVYVLYNPTVIKVSHAYCRLVHNRLDWRTTMHFHLIPP